MLLAMWCPAQPRPVEVPKNYNFIFYNNNDLRYDAASPTMKTFFEKWRRVTATHQGNVNIVHIGGSHVQAGTMSNTIRTNLMHAYPDLIAGRGMIFPYSAAAKCNNPRDYRVHCPQKVTLTRNIYKEHTYPLGLCGIAITAADSATEVAIAMNEPTVDYSTSRIIIFGHSDEHVVPLLRIADRNIYPSYADARTERFVFNLSQATDSFTVLLPCQAGERFTLTGICLDNRRSGFSFHSIGVNGASVPDYLRCQNLTRDLRLLRPDMVVFGIGINDASGKDFDTAVFRANYLALVDSIRVINPDCAFVFITNNDSFRRQRRNRYEVNRNGLLAREVFYRLANETNGAVWDQFEVMGGLKSMDKWFKAKLAQKDRVHFTQEGYVLIGNLFYNALLDAYTSYTRKHPVDRPTSTATPDSFTNPLDFLNPLSQQ
jgi:lysophospholipase L1-like esterase